MKGTPVSKKLQTEIGKLSKGRIHSKMLAGPLGQADSSALLVPITTAIAENGEQHLDPIKASVPDKRHPIIDQNDPIITKKSITEIMLCAQKLFPTDSISHSCLTIIDRSTYQIDTQVFLET
jgi:hypothetical protein